MPTYDYVCKACEHQFEQFQSMTASALRKCPECGKLQLKRLIGSGGGLIFKGSGFYITDYRSKEYQSAAEADKSSSSSSDSGSKDGSDKSKKPDATSTSKSSEPSTESSESKESGSSTAKSSKKKKD